MAIDWRVVGVEHIVQACELYDSGNAAPIRPAQNTFLRFDGNEYPAKFIRGLAYKIATGIELDPSRDYAGGMETVRFYSSLGLVTDHGRTQNLASPVTATSPSSVTRTVPPQRHALLNLLSRLFGCVETEASFDWLVVPVADRLTGFLKTIFEELRSYRGMESFAREGTSLCVDFFVPEHKLIIEYDERQHFTIPRAIALDHYPQKSEVEFDIQRWREECRRIRAVDNSPPFRDEQRAFYDTLRDILAIDNGLRILRLKDGDADWTHDDAEVHFLKLASVEPIPLFSNRSEPPVNEAEREITLKYLQRGDENWYWEHLVAELCPTANRNIVHAVGNSVRNRYEAKRKEYKRTGSQFDNSELDDLVSFIGSEASKLADISPPPVDLIPEPSQATPELLRVLHSEPPIRRIALVTHNHRIRDRKGALGYAEDFERVIQLCDAEKCDTVLFALYTWDGRTRRDHASIFESSTSVDRIILEAGDLEAHSGQPTASDVGIEIWLRGSGQPYVVQQQFSSKPNKGEGGRFIRSLPNRQIADALLLVCGENSVAEDLCERTDFSGIRTLLNPLHTYMRPRGNNDYHLTRLQMMSGSDRTAISVWNYADSRNSVPWRVLRNGMERNDMVRELPAPNPDRLDLRVGIVDLSIT